MQNDSDSAKTKIALLAAQFPALRKAPGTHPWNAVRLDAWAASGGPSHGERCSAQFILSVWNPDEDWQAGKFDLMEALRVWDDASHRAFLVWATNPWWA